MVFEKQEVFASREARDRLARRLYSDLIKLDPVEGDPDWSILPDVDRQLYRQLIEGLVESPEWPLAVLSTKGKADRKTRGPGTRRTPWVLSFIGLLLVAAGLYGGFTLAFDVVEDFVCNIADRPDLPPCDGS